MEAFEVMSYYFYALTSTALLTIMIKLEAIDLFKETFVINCVFLGIGALGAYSSVFLFDLIGWFS